MGEGGGELVLAHDGCEEGDFEGAAGSEGVACEGFEVVRGERGGGEGCGEGGGFGEAVGGGAVGVGAEGDDGFGDGGLGLGEELGEGAAVGGEGDGVVGVGVGSVPEDFGTGEVGGDFESQGGDGFTGEEAAGLGMEGVVEVRWGGEQAGVGEAFEEDGAKGEFDAEHEGALGGAGAEGHPGEAEGVQAGGAAIGEHLPGAADAEFDADGGGDFAMHGVAGAEFGDGASGWPGSEEFADIGAAAAGEDPGGGGLGGGPASV